MKAPKKGAFFVRKAKGLEPRGSLSQNNRCSGCFGLQEQNLLYFASK
jgi:hypothetical protein